MSCRALVPALASLALAQAGCGEPDLLVEPTAGTIEAIRRPVHVADARAEPVLRVVAGERVSVGDEGLGRLRLDGGPRLLVDRGAALVLVDDETVTLEAGRLFAQVDEGERLELRSEAATLRAAGAELSARASEGGLAVYVVRGEASYRSAGGARGVVRAGEEAELSGGEPRVGPAVLWQDWTGGLARPGPSEARGPEGVGALVARVPEETGLSRWPLVVRRLDVRVRLEGELAVTEVDQVFFNPASEAVEGLYRLRVPSGAVLQRFAVDRGDRLVDGYVREREQARTSYEAQVYRGSTDDPALLEWDAPGSYRARIYPIGPGESRRIVVRYVEWLARAEPTAPIRYRYPMGGSGRPPLVQELSLAVDLGGSFRGRVRAGMGATVESGAVLLRRSDFRPRADFWLELAPEAPDRRQRAWRAAHLAPRRAPGSRPVPAEREERDYYYLPLRLPEEIFGAGREPGEGLDLVVVADVSAATDLSHLELGRSVVESLVRQLGPADRLAIVTSDLTIRGLAGDDAGLGPASRERVDRLLDGLARERAGGATDLGEVLGAAAELLAGERQGAVVYVGDGAPTVGELEAGGLLERLARLPRPVRLYGVAVGAGSNLDLLAALTRGGGLAERVESRAEAAETALRILAHRERPIAQQVTVDLGPGLDGVHPRAPVDVVLGGVLPVLARVRGEPPRSVTVRGTVSGRPFERRVEVETARTDQAADLRLRWAEERLAQLLLEGEGREAVAELGTRYGLITPYTSYYVPSASELARAGEATSALVDRPLLPGPAELRRPSGAARALTALAAAVSAPLAVAGCRGPENRAIPEAERTEPSEATPETRFKVLRPPAEAEPAEGARGGRHKGEEGQMRRQDAAKSADRAANAGPAGEPDPAPASEHGREVGGEARIVEELHSAAPGAPLATPVDEDAAGALAGDEIGPTMDDLVAGSTGYGGLGLRGTGRGGGGDEVGTIGRGELSTVGRPDPQGAGGRTRGAGGGAGTGEGYGRSARPRPRSEATPSTGSDGAGPWGAAPAFEAWSSSSTTVGPAGTTTLTTVMTRTTSYQPASHRPSRCSEAARQSLADRQSLWRERLAGARGTAAMVQVHDEAIRACEAETFRERRALLDLMLARAGGVAGMIELYRAMPSWSARSYIRSAIFRRVRSPEDLRAVRAAFGVSGELDWALVEQVLGRARSEPERIRLLRRLVADNPGNFELKLRLLALLEGAGRQVEARRLGHELRSDPLSDAGVRTAVGEMHVRMGDQAEARRVWSEIVEFAPFDSHARRRLGDLYRAHGWFDDAYRQYRTLALIRPDDPSVALLLSQAAAGAGRVDEALRLEQRLMETAEPGAAGGLARVAALWSSVRLAKLRLAAREGGDADRLRALEARLRRSGVLGQSAALRVTLTWSHPDAGLSLWAAQPRFGPTRPTDIAPEHGLEAFEVAEQEPGVYRIEVRRQGRPRELRTAVEAELTVVWNEGRADETVVVLPLRFEGSEQTALAWTIDGSRLAETGPSPEAGRRR